MLRLAQIELLGFKSFPHKTVVDLDGGVTCIVGPNGSGKSNLADAISYAFGSQSGRELRAHKLAGLIFAGTDQLRPLNLASVTLHFERTVHELVPEDDTLAGLGLPGGEELEMPEVALASQPVGSQLTAGEGYSGTQLTRFVAGQADRDYDRTPRIIRELIELRPGDRVSLTRRVFRDGSGGYFINDQPVRLKDVDHFFGRYNLGRAAVYSISQGEVEKKILETPQELRGWLAEATGVALLLQQKQRAQGKLKRTRQNLERLEDIRSATRELVEDLTGQRRAAEEHLRLRDQLRAVELNEIRREIELAQRQQESGDAARRELETQLKDREADLERGQRRWRQAQQERTELEAELERGEGDLTGGRERLAQLRQQAAVARQAVSASGEALAQARQDRAALEQELERATAELTASEESAASLDGELAEIKEDEQARQREFGEAQVVLDSVAAEQAEAANRSFELAQREAALSSRLAGIDRSQQQLSGQLAARREQLEGAAARLGEGEAELSEHQRQAEELALTVGRQRDQLEEQKQTLSELGGKIEAAEKEAGERRDELAQLNSRRGTIAELAEEADDPAGGAARLLADKGLAASLSRATEITFPAELRPAFTRLLAHLGDALVGAGSLRETARGLLAEAGSDALLLHGQDEPELHADSLWRQLEAPAAVRSALIAAIGDVVVVDDVAGAEAALGDERLQAAVLRDGSALVGRSLSRLGTPAPERALQVARRSDLASLDRQIGAARKALATSEQQLAELRQAQAEAQWRLDEQTSALAAADERLRQALSLSDRLLSSVAERREQHTLLEHQAEQLSGEQQQLAADRPQLESELAEAKRQRAELAELTAQLAGQRTEAESALEQAREQHGQAVRRRELAEQRGELLRQAGLDLAERVSNLRHRDGQVEQRIASLETAIADSTREADRADGESQALSGELEEAGGRLGGLRERRAELSRAVEERQGEVARLSAETARLKQDEATLIAQRDRAAEKIGEWLEQLKERYSLTLSMLLGDPAITAPPPGATFDASEAGRGKLREEKARLGARLEELGPVNLLAIEQHEQHSQRLGFLDAQAAELERAVADLERLVTDLDASTEQRYRRSLRRIEQRFNETYLELFGSGWARLRFEDPEAIIDSGVEVEVQLPAGRRHSLRSLSGGQRSLIFLALFFAVHSVRSPGFCILDEADAALDDANVERFVKLIRSYGAEEQFVVITHNKNTMETADKLIGVVGRPKGVSNLLSVDLKAARQLVDKTVA